MSKSNAKLADQYDMSQLDPEVDPEEAAAFLQGETKINKPSRPSIVDPKNVLQPKPKPKPTTKPMTETVPKPEAKVGFDRNKRVTWTSRTIRLRQETADTLTKAACGQKTKLVEGKLNIDDPVTVQEIAERGIRLALADLGYIKEP